MKKATVVTLSVVAGVLVVAGVVTAVVASTGGPGPGGEPSATTSSTSTVEIEEGTHMLHLCGYRYLRGIGVGKFVRSGIFPAGSYL